MNLFFEFVFVQDMNSYVIIDLPGKEQLKNLKSLMPNWVLAPVQVPIQRFETYLICTSSLRYRLSDGV